jgi:hypothetical protein
MAMQDEYEQLLYRLFRLARHGRERNLLRKGWPVARACISEPMR